MLELDARLEKLVAQAAAWYRLTPEKYAETILQRELDRLAEECPNIMADVLALP